MKPDDLPQESSESIVVECELDEPREKVWRAVTVPEIVAEWLDIEPREVLSEDRLRQVQYRLRESEGVAVESTVTFELSDTPAGGTRLRIVHEDFEHVESATVMSLHVTPPRPRPATNRRRTRTLTTLRSRFLAAA
jgi:uncharacterized protein YndB with AHSA1/START domain